jgi:competence protein ComEC
MKSAIDSLAFSNSDTNALLKALLCGDRSDLSKEVTSAFRTAGASHILALSGLHLGIIYSITDMITSVCGNSITSRQVRSLLNVGICTAYTFATGASASITRALLFITLREIGIVTGRPIKLDGLLWKCLLIHLVICPKDILDIGFQLSYAAMAGIAFIFPMLQGFWPEENGSIRMKGPLKWIWTTAALSISCQITTGPLAYLHFGTFPMYFLLTNLIALPLTGIIIPAAVAVTLLTAAGWCPEILTRATEALVTALSEALEIISLM